MTGFNPFWWTEFLRAPLSGDVNQRIVTSWLSPAVTVNYQGNFDIERRVVSEVASFGKQIGWLSEIVDKLAAHQPPPGEALDKLRSAMRDIAAIKDQVRASAEKEASEALDRLEKEDRDRLRKLLRQRLDSLESEAGGTTA
jgi:hypothetical protein